MSNIIKYNYSYMSYRQRKAQVEEFQNLEIEEHAESQDDSIMTCIVQIASEFFRLKKVFHKATRKLDLDEKTKYTRQFQWFAKKVDKALEEVKLRIENVEGQAYEAGMAVAPLNIEDFEADEELFVIQMVEPIVMKENKLIKEGSVILGRKE